MSLFRRSLHRWPIKLIEEHVAGVWWAEFDTGVGTAIMAVIMFHQDPNLVTRRQLARRRRAARRDGEDERFLPWQVIEYHIDPHAVLAWGMGEDVETGYDQATGFATRQEAEACAHRCAETQGLTGQAGTLDLQKASTSSRLLNSGVREESQPPAVVAVTFYAGIRRYPSL